MSVPAALRSRGPITGRRARDLVPERCRQKLCKSTLEGHTQGSADIAKGLHWPRLEGHDLRPSPHPQSPGAAISEESPPPAWSLQKELPRQRDWQRLLFESHDQTPFHQPRCQGRLAEATLETSVPTQGIKVFHKHSPVGQKCKCENLRAAWEHCSGGPGAS